MTMIGKCVRSSRQHDVVPFSSIAKALEDTKSNSQALGKDGQLLR
jgi:hypothetical protein